MMTKTNIIRVLVMGVLTFSVGSFLIADSQTASTSQSSSADNDVSGAHDAMQKLLEQDTPVTPMTEPGKTGKAKTVQPLTSMFKSAKTPSKQKLLPEGYYLANRRGRAVKTGGEWTFVFESDGKNLSDPPVRILPNRWLEKMESDMTSAGSGEMIFLVSGEVTVYHAQNYILLRKVLIERDVPSTAQ